MGWRCPGELWEPAIPWNTPQLRASGSPRGSQAGAHTLAVANIALCSRLWVWARSLAVPVGFPDPRAGKGSVWKTPAACGWENESVSQPSALTLQGGRAWGGSPASSQEAAAGSLLVLLRACPSGKRVKNKVRDSAFT